MISTYDHKKGTIAAVIPVFNHWASIASVVNKTKNLGIPVIVVDDGSTDSTGKELEKIEGIILLKHGVNRGKGAAILTAMAFAANSFDWIITIDADGQHDPEDARQMMEALPNNGTAIIVGNRQGMLAAHAPWTSRFGRKFSNFWVWVSGGPFMADSQSGLRIYPVRDILELDLFARRFQFEIEVMVKARLAGIPVTEVPVSVSYNPGTKRISHFHPFFDFLRNFGTFTRLIFKRVTGLGDV